MTPARFLTRVTLETSIAVLALAFAATWVFGARAGLGVIAGGAFALGNVWWLARGALSISDPKLAQARWSLSVALRFLALAAAVGVVLGTGLAHPVALVVGLTVLPLALIVEGLRGAGTAS